jgi:RNA recognition motif-containing protein
MVERIDKEEDNTPITLFIGNLSYRSTPDDISKLLTPYGEVLAVDIARDKLTGRSRGFAFVTFTISESGNLYELDGLVLDNRTLKINDAEKHRKIKQNKKRKKKAF